MRLKELLELIVSLQPAAAALEAHVSVVVGNEDFEVVDASYGDGNVSIETDAPPRSSYDEGYDDGYAAGKSDQEGED